MDLIVKSTTSAERNINAAKSKLVEEDAPGVTARAMSYVTKVFSSPEKNLSDVKQPDKIRTNIYNSNDA